ncbi:Asp-tRNAAsn/Glu-tRNAGln amidotransferase A subunit [Paraburkholderia diazotrophica]|uniref:Asp-tRNAAsn/Glu-tRNAGln amidotransferase A subunit n=2 Tax=Paraburkholderia diazotrophica TaxID=667676 RepID=A0A1H7EK06_9BURK|nr:Asp-tRNAAsn/Glu-tRNAGln amidotransferase A subunit [Paraburkholderia diazotrophica]
MIGRREISPVELMDACIERIETVNPAVNAIAATCFAEAREEARQAERAVLKGERLGLLHGLPLGVKDLEDTAGLLTTYGSPIYRSHVPDKDGLIVERLRASGAILAAKTNVPEMGAGANTRNPVWGATGNPFNPELNAGGSSGGSAAALACDMLPVCTGSDTGGSLRIPASKCGVVGFRPTPGLVPNSRRPLGWTPISVVGPMGRTVADTALQLAATSGLSAVDPLSYEVDPLGFASLDEFDLSTLRVGWTEDFGVCDVDETIRQTFRSRIAAISGLVHSCQEVSFVLGDAHRCFDVIRAEGFVAGLHDAYSRNPEDLGANARVNYELGAQMSLADCAWAHAEQTRLMRRFQATFSDCDVILAPTTPVSPFPWRQAYAMTISGRQQENYYRWLALTYVVTLTTNPAISMPCGVDEFGMPFGIQVVGPFRNDRRLLTIALAFERAFEQRPSLRRPKPDLSRLGEPTLSLTSIVTAPPIFNPAGDYQTGTSIV